jgi:hypothetical protein
MAKEEMKNKYQNALLSLVILVVFGFIAYKIYSMQEKHIVHLKDQTAAELKKNEVLKDIKGQELRLASYRAFLKQKDASSVIETIGTLAKELKVSIISVKPDRELATSAYTTLPLYFTVEAENYHVLGKFISRLESHPDVYFVQTATIRPVSDNKHRISMDLKIGTVLYKE